MSEWNDLCIDENEVEVEIKGAKIKLKPLSWIKIEELRGRYITINPRTGITNIREDEYELALLKEAIVSGPFEPHQKEEFIRKLKLDVKDKLFKKIKEIHEISEETTKN